MTQEIMKACLIVVLFVTLLGRGRAQSDCTTALLSLTPCLNYVTGSSATPSGQCCSQLGNIVNSNPRCLCSLLNGGGSSLGVSINQTLALSLPDQCKVQTPPISQCNSVGAEGPAAGPSSVNSPASSPISNEAKPPTSSSLAPNPSGSAERVEGGPSPATSPTSDEEPETPNTPSVPPISSVTTSKTAPATTSKTDPATKGSTSGGIMITGSFSISMLVLFFSALASMAINA